MLVDRVLEFEEHKYLRAVKNVSVNEPFSGHFPAKPIFLCVLIPEAMAQATGIPAFKSVGKLEPGELYYFAGIDEARFKPSCGARIRWSWKSPSRKLAAA